MILAITFVIAVTAIVYALLATHIYRAEVVLAPVSRSSTTSNLSGLGGLANLAGINLSVGGDTVRYLAILRSRNFIEEFIRDNDLLPTLFSDEWDAENGRWINEDPEHQPDIRDGVDLFTKKIRFISEDARTGLVTLAIEWTDAETVAVWASELVGRINVNTRRRDIQEIQKKLDYLNEQLANADLVELRQAISRVIEEQINAMMLVQAQTEYAFTVIDPAVVPKERIHPRRTMIVIIATFLGGFLGIFIVLARCAGRRLVDRRALTGSA